MTLELLSALRHLLRLLVRAVLPRHLQRLLVRAVLPRHLQLLLLLLVRAVLPRRQLLEWAHLNLFLERLAAAKPLRRSSGTNPLKHNAQLERYQSAHCRG